jgi:glutamyl-tRNA reductase
MVKRIWAAEVFTTNLPCSVKEKLESPEFWNKPAFGVKKRGLDEVFVLSTHGQVVVFGVGSSIDPLLSFFLQDPLLYHHVHFYKSTEASIHLLFATVCGLCAPIRGSRQPLIDARNAFERAMQFDGIGLVLDQLIRRALCAGESIATQSGIHELSLSLVENAIDLVINQHDENPDLSVLVIGENDVAARAVEYCQRQGVRKVMLCASAASPIARGLASELKMELIDYSEVSPFFHLADVVIKEETGALCPKDVLLRFKNRGSRKIMLDLGTCVEFHRQMRDLPLMTLYTYDDIHKSPLASGDLLNAIEVTWKLIEDETRDLVPALEALHTVPLLKWCWTGPFVRSHQYLLQDFDNRPATVAAKKNFYQSLLKEKSQTIDPQWLGETRMEIPSSHQGLPFLSLTGLAAHLRKLTN